LSRNCVPMRVALAWLTVGAAVGVVVANALGLL
jgi:hypothetical protein